MIYHFRLTTGRKDFFLREYHLLSTDSLYDFHRFIQSDLDFDDSQIAAFFTEDTKGKQHQYSLFDTGDGAMDTISLEHLFQDGCKVLRYMFDFFHSRFLIIELLGEVERLPRKSYPLLVESKGDAPDQFEERPLPDPIPVLDVVVTEVNDLDEDLSEDEEDDEEEEEENGYDESDFDLLAEVEESEK